MGEIERGLVGGHGLMVPEGCDAVPRCDTRSVVSTPVQEPTAPRSPPAQERTLALMRRDRASRWCSRGVRRPTCSSEADHRDRRSCRRGCRARRCGSARASSPGCTAARCSTSRPTTSPGQPATAAGFVAHKAIELSLNWRGEPHPARRGRRRAGPPGRPDRPRGRYVAGAHRRRVGRTAQPSRRSHHQVPAGLPAAPARRRNPVLEAAAKWSRAAPSSSRARSTSWSAARRGEEPAAHHRLQERRPLVPPPRRPALLRTGADAAPRCRRASWSPTTSTTATARWRTSPRARCRSALRRTLDGHRAPHRAHRRGPAAGEAGRRRLPLVPAAGECAEGKAFLRGDDADDIEP